MPVMTIKIITSPILRRCPVSLFYKWRDEKETVKIYALHEEVIFSLAEGKSGEKSNDGILCVKTTWDTAIQVWEETFPVSIATTVHEIQLHQKYEFKRNSKAYSQIYFKKSSFQDLKERKRFCQLWNHPILRES